MDKKKLLIVNKTFALGGIESSMINMANELSRHYEVHLFIYNPVGVLKDRLNSNVKVIDPSWKIRCLGMSLKDAMQSRNLKIVFFRLFATIWSKLFCNNFPIAIAIKSQNRMCGYDLAIAYHHEYGKNVVTSGFARVIDKCVDARKKIAWLHYDCSTIELDRLYNKPFYEKMDAIVCVSKSVMDNFAKANPELSDRVEYCYNFLPYDLVKEKSLERQSVPYSLGKFVCFSACRLAKEKALVRGVSALSDVLKMHNEIVWYIAGEGPERSNIEKAIKANGLEEQVVLIGNQPNPYPYMRNADLVLNVSYHEAAPMVFLESKTLGTPVFATRTSSAEELLRNNIDSFVCDNSEEGIRERFAWLMENRECVKNAKLRLVDYCASNDESMLKIKKWLE